MKNGLGFGNVKAVKVLPVVLLTLVFLACYLSGILRLSSEENNPVRAIPNNPVREIQSEPINTGVQNLQGAVVRGLKAASPECPKVFNAAGHLTTNQQGRLAVMDAAMHSDTSGNMCQPELVSYLIRTINGPGDDRPQLTFDQLSWIGLTVAVSAASILNSPSCLEEGGGGCTHNFLVWGMGRDSHVWMNANCIPDFAKGGGKIRTRTVFLENYESWFNMIRGKFPMMEGYLVEYKGKVERADEFFQNPYIMTVPETMKDTCFSVALVDGPQGYLKHQPGRMEAAYWSLSMAKRCLTEKKLDVVHIFLHDVGRPVEKQIIKQFLYPNSQFLGFVDGTFGELAGFRLTRSTLQVEGKVGPTE